MAAAVTFFFLLSAIPDCSLDYTREYTICKGEKRIRAYVQDTKGGESHVYTDSLYR